MPAPAFASAPLSEPVMQAFVVGSAYGGRQPPYGPLVLRAVEMHLEMHFPLDPMNFDSTLPVVVSHFCTSLRSARMPTSRADTRQRRQSPPFRTIST